ncbi:hypothetical protein [Caldalkalibacillus salinus]|uniref:hypothetical protein n=1 Tax=Caldalkalibacillus salinus TaxID=2803787 RepID=UPI00192286DD|nr:hypothetical protein [Caldalkalibacillus salinus]
MRSHIFEIVVKPNEHSIVELPLPRPMKIKVIKREGRLHTEFSMLHINGKFKNVNPSRDLFIFDRPVFVRENLSLKVRNREPCSEKITIEIMGY